MDPQNTQNPLGNPMISTPQGGGITGNPQAFPQGDIIISSAPAKKSKKPLVIVIIILVLLAASSFAVYTFRNDIFPVSISLISQKANEAISLIENGSEDFIINYAEDEESEFQNAVFAVRISEISDKQKLASYYKKLNELNSTLKTYKINDEKSAINIKELTETIDILNYTINYNEISNTIKNINEIYRIDSDPVLKHFSENYFAYYQNYLDNNEEEMMIALAKLRDPIELKALSNTIKNTISKVRGVIHE